MKIISGFIFLCVLNILPTQAQIGKILKDKAKSAINDPTVRRFAKDKFSDELEKARDEYDTTSFNYAIALSDNAGLFENKERFERQQKFLLEYIDRKDGYVSESDRARSWVDRSEMLYANGKYKMAFGLLLAAKTTYETEGDTRSIDYARSIANLSLVSHSLGRLHRAEEFGLLALELRKDILGTESRGYAASLNNMALIKKDLGFYNESEKLLNEALDKNKRILGSTSMGYAICLNNLASLYQMLGRYQEAEPLFKQAIQIADDHLREKSGNFQRLQTNMALLYQDMGRYGEAEEIYLEAISIKKKRFGENHPDYAHLLNNLASLYVLMEKYDDVESLLKKSIAIYENNQGNDSPVTATSKSDLGNYYVFRGENDKALPLLTDAFDVRMQTLGASHPNTIQSKEDLAIVYWRTQDISKAKKLYKEVLENTYYTIDQYFLPMSENEKSKFWAKLRPRINRFYSFVYENQEAHPELLIDLINLQINTKALLMTSTNKIRNQIANSGSQELKDTYNTWIDQKELLSNYYTYSKEELADEKINIDSLEKATNQTERYLSENSDVFKNGVKANKFQYADLKKALVPGDALVEIIQSRIFKNSLTSSMRYLAVIIKNNSAAPKLISLENGDQLDTRYYKYYSNVIHNKMDDEYSYDQYWKKIDDNLKGAKRVFISPDGVFNQINVNTLRIDPTNYVLNKYNLVLINNPGDVVDIGNNKSVSLKKNATLIGFPDYGGDGSVSPLPGTKLEIDKINTLLKSKQYKSQVISGSSASENAVK
ncbi:MAG: tetratricopeptide repeat protein, partial [Cyclobacteriaceae bacterium]|nr:tetratricopeptide repeat protein [Cyclobacteriaceae bacterium]